MSTKDWVDTAFGNLKLWTNHPNADYLLSFAQLDLLKACGQKSLTKTDKEKLISGLVDDAREHLHACVTHPDYSPELRDTLPAWQKYTRCLSAALSLERSPHDKIAEYADVVLQDYLATKQEASASHSAAVEGALALNRQKTYLVRGQLSIWSEASLAALRNPDFTVTLKTLLGDSFEVVHALVTALEREGLMPEK